MKQIKSLVFTFIAFPFLTATAFAEKVTFVKEYNYNASDLDSKVSCSDCVITGREVISTRVKIQEMIGGESFQ